MKTAHQIQKIAVNPSWAKLKNTQKYNTMQPNLKLFAIMDTLWNNIRQGIRITKQWQRYTTKAVVEFRSVNTIQTQNRGATNTVRSHKQQMEEMSREWPGKLNWKTQCVPQAKVFFFYSMNPAGIPFWRPWNEQFKICTLRINCRVNLSRIITTKQILT